jgi:hypothetical protein
VERTAFSSGNATPSSGIHHSDQGSIRSADNSSPETGFRPSRRTSGTVSGNNAVPVWRLLLLAGRLRPDYDQDVMGKRRQRFVATRERRFPILAKD